MPTGVKKFDPEGTGYDYGTAEKHGLKRNASGHLPSRSPRSGQLLKGRSHPTYSSTIVGEADAGHEIYKGANGKYYSRPIPVHKR